MKTSYKQFAPEKECGGLIKPLTMADLKCKMWNHTDKKHLFRVLDTVEIQNTQLEGISWIISFPRCEQL